MTVKRGTHTNSERGFFISLEFEVIDDPSSDGYRLDFRKGE